MRRIHDQRIDGRRAGFTIIELIVAMAVVSVLASLWLRAVSPAVFDSEYFFHFFKILLDERERERE